ncbi:hypothetical protein Q5Y75_26230 [Ruegeria sp. 2205SS24-7]|uniref:hypothetical protein n=1 Tax=Ruegeria discodermiae TaxID=3064389 RepID=UPI0027407C91|nr:hypothetical protein [Ruegeria sp. 2205SS24-7]MDP5220690.1 hypothetical protein [Ruegeria sp. 2205SS24-7]
MTDKPEQNRVLTRQDHPATSLVALVLIGVAAFAAALLTRVGMIDHPLIYDELYQYLPSVSWQENQSFAVLDGIYDRAARFSQLIALSFGIMGEQSASAARLIPSILPGALLVSLVVAWAYRVSGVVTALIALVFLLFWPNGIEVAQYIRFYSLQGVLFVAGALLVYVALVEFRSLAWQLVTLAAAAVLFLLALDLQVLTAVGVGAVGLWVLLVFAPGWLRAYPRLWWGVGLVLAVVVAILVSGVFAAELKWLWATYTWEPWPAQNDTTFYHRDFRDNYPTFWPLFPVIAIIALRANFLPASFCLILFATTFVLQSFGGLKNIRYLYPTMPFFFVLWGIGLQAVFPAVWRFLKDGAAEAMSFLLPASLKKPFAWLVLIVAAGFLVFANPAFIRSTKLMLGKDENTLLGKTRWQWTDAETLLAPWLADNALIVTEEEMRAVEWLGDFDLAYNRPRFSEFLYSRGTNMPSFSVDHRTGRPLIGDFSDFELTVRCTPVGVFITNQPGVRHPNITRLLQDTRDADLHFTLQTGSGSSLVGWRHGETMSLPADCDRLPDFGTPSAAGRILSGQSEPQSVSSATADR